MRKIMSQQTLVLGLVLSATWTLGKSLLSFVKWYSERVNIKFPWNKTFFDFTILPPDHLSPQVKNASYWATHIFAALQSTCIV